MDSNASNTLRIRDPHLVMSHRWEIRLGWTTMSHFHGSWGPYILVLGGFGLFFTHTIRALDVFDVRCHFQIIRWQIHMVSYLFQQLIIVLGLIHHCMYVYM